ncbi:C2H2-type zinc finger [Carpediemonas membranifera]|uniref:C2H2-type zinc finger n=1 Tax=Carpediemonas membranifera TaxID=201153 RepID=A0A8J6BEN8_9EUKA|nr:C2H2-type zinc finger [Carpediemonas membranifera]|eukprot:KAG9395877.1 C2H2-type zinc finger [Carpediemonas membranifera]
MAKRPKRELSKRDKLSIHRQTLLRVSYLFQASVAVANVNPELAISYIRMMRSIAQKNVIRIHPELRRSFCEHCCFPLVPGKTTALTPTIAIRCPHCSGTSRMTSRRMNE